MFLVNTPRLLIIEVISFIPCSSWSVWSDALHKLLDPQIIENYNIHHIQRGALCINTCNI